MNRITVLNNKKKLSIYALGYMIIFFGSILGVGFMWMRNPFDSFIVLKYIFLVTGGISLLLYINTKYFEYDCSGEIISLKTYHPLLRHRERRTEFPKDKLKNFNISDQYLGTEINLLFNSYKPSPVKIKYNINGLNKKQVNQLKNSLQKIVKSNYPEETEKNETPRFSS